MFRIFSDVFLFPVADRLVEPVLYYRFTNLRRCTRGELRINSSVSVLFSFFDWIKIGDWIVWTVVKSVSIHGSPVALALPCA